MVKCYVGVFCYPTNNEDAIYNIHLSLQNTMRLRKCVFFLQMCGLSTFHGLCSFFCETFPTLGGVIVANLLLCIFYWELTFKQHLKMGVVSSLRNAQKLDAEMLLISNVVLKSSGKSLAVVSLSSGWEYIMQIAAHLFLGLALDSWNYACKYAVVLN